MNRRLGITVVVILALAGCGRDASPPAAQSTSATAAASSSAVAQTPTGEGGNIPDPCTLLTDAGASTRYCQWQQSSGQLAVFLSRATSDDFTGARADSPSIPGIGDDAYW